MAYIEPLVMVYQEYESLSTTTQTAQLPACIIGPCYQIVDADEDEALANIAGGYVVSGLTGVAIPNVAAGAVIDESSMQFRFKNPRVQLAADMSIAEATLNEIKPAAESLIGTIAVGDIIKFSGYDSEWRVYSVDSTKKTFLVNMEVPGVTVNRYIAFSAADYAANAEAGLFKLNGVVWRKVTADSDNNRYSVERNADQSATAVDVNSKGTLSVEYIVNTSLKFSVERQVDEFTLSLEDAHVTADISSYKFSASGITAAVNGTDYPVTQAELYVGYRALRQDLSSIGVAYTVDEIKASLGKIDPRNPLAFGVNIALANASDTGIYYVGVDSDDTEGYTAAKDKLETYSPLYAIAPLTQDVGILNIFKLHAVSMSEAEAGQWRIVIGNTALPTEVVLAESNTDSSVGTVHKGTLAADGDGDLCWLKDAYGNFLSSSCDSGDTLVIRKIDEENDVVYENSFTVESVPTDDIIIVLQNADFGDVANSPYAAGDVVEYKVVHKYNKEGQAKAIAAASEAFGSRRFVHVWPDICVVDGKELPGYYLCCAVAGAISSLQPHYGLTRLSIAGIEAVKHSGDMFNRSQLNTIAGGGTFIFVQDVPTAAPYIRHQLTTEYGTVEFQEVSFVKNFDYVCYILKDVLQQYIGRWNITPSTIAAVEDSISAVLASQMSVSYPMIGSPVLGFSDVHAEQSEFSKDRVEAYCNVTFPYPLNTLAVHVISE